MRADVTESAQSARANAGRIEAYLDELTRSAPEPRELRDAVRYALLGGGKRVRPLLALQSCVAAGGEAEASLPAAAAVELVHTFSLVHDDLPALDNDDLRRGRATLHVHAGEAMAILAGDAMLAMAFGVLAGSVPDPSLSAALARELAEATAAMIAGQVEDTLGGAGSAGSTELLERIHRNKTGALFRASCRMGALSGLSTIAGGGRDHVLQSVTAYGECVGLMFQIADDLLDATSTAEQTGKRTRKDRDAGKLTYPSLLGIEGSRAEMEKLLGVALEAVAGLGPCAAGLRELAGALASRTR